MPGRVNEREEYRFGFTGHEKENDISGNGNVYTTEYRLYDARLGVWQSVDTLFTKYPSWSSYNYVMNNPVNNIDIKGDDVAILLAANAVGNQGHMAILIQNKNNKWVLWSKNGEGKSASESLATPDHAPKNQNQKEYDNIQAFLNSTKDNKDGNDPAPYYTHAYMIPTTAAQDRKVEQGMQEGLNEQYQVLSSNCAQAVNRGLEKAGVPTKPKKDESLFSRISQALSSMSEAYSSSPPNATDLMDNTIPVTMYKNYKAANPNGKEYKTNIKPK
jgi:RHS repeat-associated protein